MWILTGVLFFGVRGGGKPVHAQPAISLQGGNVSLRVTADANGVLQPATDTKTTLRYRRQSTITKVTVETSVLSQSFVLSVELIGATAGTAAGEVTLTEGMPPVDLLLNVPSGNQREEGSLRYTATADLAQGNSLDEGTDEHTVTYTLTAQ